MVDARKKRRGEIGYIALGTFSDNTRRIIDIDDEYLDLETQITRPIWRLTHLTETFKDSIPRWLNQPNYVEVWIEKSAMAGKMENSILNDRKVRIAPNRGWTSLEFLHMNMERLEDQIANQPEQFSGITDIWILYIGDFDPSGLKMDGLYEKALAELETKLGASILRGLH